jgi:hypothetical protein
MCDIEPDGRAAQTRGPTACGHAARTRTPDPDPDPDNKLRPWPFTA